MSCCGQRRRELRREPAWHTRPPAAPPVLDAPTPVRYLGDTQVIVRGRATGLTYLFNGSGETLTVDGRDVPGLVAMGRFVADGAAGPSGPASR